MTYLAKAAAGLAFAALLSAQTADELVNKNLTAHGGIEKLKALHSLRMTGKMQQGSFTAQLALDSMAPDLVRQAFTIMGMTAISAYDGAIGWRIMPFGGRKDPEMLGDDDLRGVQDEADFYGHLADYKEKGNTIEYLGHDTVDGDDAYRLKVTLKNGDIIYYYLDPETFLEGHDQLDQVEAVGVQVVGETCLGHDLGRLYLQHLYGALLEDVERLFGAHLCCHHSSMCSRSGMVTI